MEIHQAMQFLNKLSKIHTWGPFSQHLRSQMPAPRPPCSEKGIPKNQVGKGTNRPHRHLWSQRGGFEPRYPSGSISRCSQMRVWMIRIQRQQATTGVMECLWGELKVGFLQNPPKGFKKVWVLHLLKRVSKSKGVMDFSEISWYIQYNHLWSQLVYHAPMKFVGLWSSNGLNSFVTTYPVRFRIVLEGRVLSRVTFCSGRTLFAAWSSQVVSTSWASDSEVLSKSSAEGLENKSTLAQSRPKL